jgi:hypothetical protein
MLHGSRIGLRCFTVGPIDTIRIPSESVTSVKLVAPREGVSCPEGR